MTMIKKVYKESLQLYFSLLFFVKTAQFKLENKPQSTSMYFEVASKKCLALHLTRGICGVAPLLGLRHICPAGKRHIPRERYATAAPFKRVRNRHAFPIQNQGMATFFGWRPSYMFP